MLFSHLSYYLCWVIKNMQDVPSKLMNRFIRYSADLLGTRLTLECLLASSHIAGRDLDVHPSFCFVFRKPEKTWAFTGNCCLFSCVMASSFLFVVILFLHWTYFNPCYCSLTAKHDLGNFLSPLLRMWIHFYATHFRLLKGLIKKHIYICGGVPFVMQHDILPRKCPRQKNI